MPASQARRARRGRDVAASARCGNLLLSGWLPLRPPAGARKGRPAAPLQRAFDLGPDCPARTQCAGKPGSHTVRKRSLHHRASSITPPRSFAASVARQRSTAPSAPSGSGSARTHASASRTSSRSSPRSRPEGACARSSSSIGRGAPGLDVLPPCRRRYSRPRHVSVTERRLKRANRRHGRELRGRLRTKSQQRLVESRTSFARSPSSSTSTSARRTRSPVATAASPAASSARSRSSSSARSRRSLTEQHCRPQRRRESPSPAPSSESSELRSCSDANGSAWKSESSQRSSASASSRSSSAIVRRPRSLFARSAVSGSIRTGSPGGGVAAIGSTGRIPYGRQVEPLEEDGAGRDRARVASRSAVTASASSPGASGGLAVVSRQSPARARAGSSRSTSRPKPAGSRPRACGQ